jgi:nucleoside-diphosphate-sugar epimerase
MSGKRIVFTGGTGKAGRHAVPHLVAHGYAVLNVDLKPLDLPGVPTLIADLTDSGQAFNALTTHPTFGGFERGHPPRPPDAVVHFAAIPRVLIEPDNVTFATNVISTYNVIEAAMKLGVRKVVIASSETTYGSASRRATRTSIRFRSRRTTTSTRWTPTASPKSATKRPRAPSRCATRPTSTRCASAT